jgi:hypothetical protein
MPCAGSFIKERKAKKSMTFSNRSCFIKRLMAGLLCTCLLLSGCGASGSAEGGKEPAAEEAPDAAVEEKAEEKEEAEELQVPEAEEEWKRAYDTQKDAALIALLDRLYAPSTALYVYKDFGLTDNHFTQKAKMGGSDLSLVKDMNENWQEDPYAGDSCIRCEQTTREGDWGGWLFLNGYLPRGESIPRLNDGSSPGQGLDLTGAEALLFHARGEKGGETVEFFTAGFGYDGETGVRTVEYPDSCGKQSLGRITLTQEWQEYIIPLQGQDLSSIVCGFGYVLNDGMDGNSDSVFYLDEICFIGEIKSILEPPVLLRSYDTDNVYIQNAAYTYDNALAAMAFLSEGMEASARQILDAFVYAIENDRAQGRKRIRNAYSAGDISALPGWESGARLPGWYDREDGTWYEDRYQVGSNVGNTSYAALALIQYYNRFGGSQYLQAARDIMDWVLETCQDGRDGFTAGFDGWEEGDPPVVYPFSYKSIEHNIDAFAVFGALYGATGEAKYYEAAQSAKNFILSMYSEEKGCFMTGTTEDGITPNESVTALDAQVWCAMALGDTFKDYEKALQLVDQMKTPEGGYPFCAENRNGGWWAEGTAYTALMFREREEISRYREAMDALCGIQLESGLFPAATNDHLSTGMELFDGSPWEYSTDPHIAPAAWFVMAANGFNPYLFPDIN